MLKIGSTDINKAYLGSTGIGKAYLGSTEVFSPSSYNAYFQAVINEANSQSFTLPNEAELLEKNTLFDTLDGLGWFDACEGMLLMKSQQEDFSRIDCANTSNIATYGNSPFVANSGTKGNAFNKYVSTGINPFGSTIVADNDIAVHFWVTHLDTTTTGRYYCTDTQRFICQDKAASFFYRTSDEGLGSLNSTRQVGLYSIIRSGNNVTNLYINGVQVALFTEPKLSLLDEAFDLFRKPSGSNYGDGGLSLFAITDSSVETDILDIYNAFNTYL